MSSHRTCGVFKFIKNKYDFSSNQLKIKLVRLDTKTTWKIGARIFSNKKKSVCNNDNLLSYLTQVQSSIPGANEIIRPVIAPRAF